MSPPSPAHTTARKISRARRRKVAAVSQCDSCEVCGCRQEDLHRRDELLAMMSDKVKPDCTDRVIPFWERVNE